MNTVTVAAYVGALRRSIRPHSRRTWIRARRHSIRAARLFTLAQKGRL